MSSSDASSIRVLKFGGSLLDTDAIERLPAWLAAQPLKRNLLIAGGGMTVDSIRRKQSEQGFDDVVAHWKSIEAMDDNTQRVHHRLQGLGAQTRLLSSIDDITNEANWESCKICLLTVGPFLRERDIDNDVPLPSDWTVTSDSIAARVATVTRASELVLLKSTLPRSATSSFALAKAGYVDEFFPTAATSKTIRYVNAQLDPWQERAGS